MSRRRLLLLTLLTSGTGAMDAMAFLALGGVFVSVMTGNLVLLGLGVTDRDLATRCSLAIAAYVIGAAVGARIAARPGGAGTLPGGVVAAVWLELACISAFTVIWELQGGTPTAGWQFPLIVPAALAMGVRSSAIRSLGAGTSTTYLTGILTAMIDEAVHSGTRQLWRGLPIIAAVSVGAVGSGLLVVNVPRAAPLWPLAILVAVLAIRRPGDPATDALRNGRG